MKVVVIYRSDSEHGREVEEFLDNFRRQTGRELETISPDEKEGRRLCEAYDIVEYPTLLALSDDSQMQAMWRGLPLPTISEVSYYS